MAPPKKFILAVGKNGKDFPPFISHSLYLGLLEAMETNEICSIASTEFHWWIEKRMGGCNSITKHSVQSLIDAKGINGYISAYEYQSVDQSITLRLFFSFELNKTNSLISKGNQDFSTL